MNKIIKSLLELKLTVQSGIAGALRRFDSRTLIIVGIIATGAAVFSYAVDTLVKSKSQAKNDNILKIRLSGPAPSPNIVIVDIDERTLALLAKSRGNWPWPRDTLADGLQKLGDLGARSVLFNVLMSDLDKRNADADAAMEITAGMIRQTAFPMIRLNPQNDAESQLTVDKLPGVEITAEGKPAPTVAVILPVFASMQDRLGVANQLPDEDGIVRQYPLNWEENGYKLPSIVKMTAIAGGVDPNNLPDKLTLNWRNKKARYQRISFADVLTMEASSPQAAVIRGAFIILGVSAPGIGQIKPTAVSSIEDDNEIMATALDDTLNRTYFRTTPGWILLIISIAAVWGLVWLGIVRMSPDKINRAFILLQLGLGGITLLAASYTYFLIDLSGAMSFALLVFAAVKLVRNMSDNAARAKPGYRKSAITADANCLTMIGFKFSKAGRRTSRQWEQQVQQIAGLSHVIRIDDLFGGNSFVVNIFSDYQALIVLTNESKKEAILSVFENAPPETLNIMSRILPADLDISSESFKQIVADMLAQNASRIFSATASPT